MLKRNDTAVSPVVGVMLMLVLTIIIAAIVSAYAGGIASEQKKVPQAMISGTYSISNGFQIAHNGGDGLALHDMVFVVRNGPMFGPNLERKTAQVLDKTLIADRTGRSLDNGDGTSEVTSFRPGDVLYISAENATGSRLQPGLADAEHLWFSNTTNIGNAFSLEVSDTGGNLISVSDVVISP